MYVALVGAVIFILIQLWLLVFFARSFSNRIHFKVEKGGNNRCCWYGLPSLCCYSIVLAGTLAMFFYFGPCKQWENCIYNNVFIGVNFSLCVFLTLCSVFMCSDSKTNIPSSLLQSGIISVYITYLTWTALWAIPSKQQQADTTIPIPMIITKSLPYVGIVIMFFTVVYSRFKNCDLLFFNRSTLSIYYNFL